MFHSKSRIMLIGRVYEELRVAVSCASHYWVVVTVLLLLLPCC